jgi:hypothetical protein
MFKGIDASVDVALGLGSPLAGREVSAERGEGRTVSGSVGITGCRNPFPEGCPGRSPLSFAHPWRKLDAFSPANDLGVWYGAILKGPPLPAHPGTALVPP